MRLHNKVCALFPDNKVRFARAEQLWRIVLLRLSSDVKYLNLVVHVAMHSNVLPRDYFSRFVQWCTVTDLFCELQELLHFEFVVRQVLFCVWCFGLVSCTNRTNITQCKLILIDLQVVKVRWNSTEHRSVWQCITPHWFQRRSQDFTLGGGPQKLSAEGARIETEGCSLPNRLGTWGASWTPPGGPGRSPVRQCIFSIFEAHRTLLVERTVLLYWIKQALRPNKAIFR